MKSHARKQFVNLSLILGIVTYFTLGAGHLAGTFWEDYYSEIKLALPNVTSMATKYGALLPLVCCVISIICAIVLPRKDKELEFSWQIYSYIVTVMLMGITFLALFYLYPIMKIDFILP